MIYVKTIQKFRPSAFLSIQLATASCVQCTPYRTTGIMVNDRCQECRDAVSQYQCPRCSRRTCSLECCQSHKQRTGCNGKRDRTTFLRLEQMNDSTVNSDYFFLENVLQTMDGGKRLLKQVGAIAGGVPQRLLPKVDDDKDDNVHDDDDNRRDQKRRKPNVEHFPPKWRRLVQQAKERDVTLLFMPPGMERHKSNTTHFHAKSNALLWKLEFAIHDDGTCATRIVSQNKVPEDAILRHEWEKVAPNMDADQELHFMLKMIPCPANRPSYVELDMESSLKDALKGMTVIEYPTIDVVVATELHRFPKLIQEVM